MASLERVVGLPGAVLLGIGSIVGTGIFVSLGVAAGVAGPAVLIAVGLAAMVATCNALSSAQLAAAHPVSGGTYEYGYRLLHPWAGRAAGWSFLVAKSASAATAALGLAGYALEAAGIAGRGARIGAGIAVVAAMTALVAGGLRRSSRVNAVIVSVTLLALASVIVAGAPEVEAARLRPELDAGALLQATALLFVAFAGYARIATLGEEVREPERTIPRAIIATLVLSTVLYVAIAAVAVGVLGADGLADATRASAAPLDAVARASALPAVRWAVAVGAVTAMLGVLLNLLLGLSRVALAMARRGDLPRGLAHVDGGTPRAAVLAIGAVAAALVTIGDVAKTWSLSAFSVLFYYAITNAAALRLPDAQRRYPRAIAVAGLVACVGLAPWALRLLG